MSKQQSVVWLSLVLVCIALSTASAETIDHSYVEDFTSLQFCDTVSTTAHWDTLAGEVKPYLFQIALAGSADTPGDADDITICGNYAYVADRTYGIQVIDISDPASPVLAGNYDTPGSAHSVAISGDYAYVADEAYGLQVLDIHDPTAPAFAGSCWTPGYPVDVVVSGDFAYIADYTSRLQVIDISDPASPTISGSYTTAGHAYDVAISGDYAYIACDAAGLQVLDISDPTTPVFAGSYATSKSAWDVVISGNYAYLAEYGSGLQVIDISDPTTPSLAGTYSGSVWASGVWVSGDYAYVANRTLGLQVLDISDPENPVSEGVFDTVGSARDVAVAGQYAFVADGSSGLQVVQVSVPAEPAFAGSNSAPGRARDVEVSGDYAFVADWDAGLQVIDISDLTAPVSAGGCVTPGSARGIAVSGDYAYVAGWDAGLQIVDISDPTAPTIAASYDTIGSSYDVAISGDYAYVAHGYLGLMVVDISDPTSPALAGHYEPGFGGYQGLALSGDFAYVVNYDHDWGFQTIDIRDPANPAPVGARVMPGIPDRVALSGDYAFVTTDYSVEVIDISDAVSLELVDYYSLGTDGHGIAISGDFAYVAADDSGLVVIDIRYPTNLFRAGRYQTPDESYGVALSGDYAFVADYRGGLQVIGVSQRLFDTESNTAQSLWIDNSDDAIVSARLTTSQTDSIRWEVTNNGWGSWVELSPGYSYRTFPNVGSDLRWRSVHVYGPTQPDVNPTCTSLQIDWLYQFAMIDSIVDVPNDQGGWARVYFTRSGYDLVDEPEFPNYPVAMYGIYRRIDDAALLTRVVAEGEAVEPGESDESMLQGQAGGKLLNLEGRSFMVFGGTLSSGPPPGIWELLGSVPAHQQDEYIYLAPTLADSSETLKHSVYCISAETTKPSVYYFSYPDSGYSLDNLAPAAPSGLTMPSAADLAWDECPDEDFNYFTVYGSTAAELDSTAALLGYTIETLLDISGDQYDYYLVTATDFAGNEGEASSVENTFAGVRPGEDLPLVFALKQNRPNPFESETMIAFDLPEPCAVRLEVMDVQGRVVRVLTDEAWPAGRHSVSWAGKSDGGDQAGPGVYFVRMQTGDFTATNKMLLMK